MAAPRRILMVSKFSARAGSVGRAKLNDVSGALLADEAIYQRTLAGQNELTDRHGRLSRLERRFLSAVTGYTSLRVLLDLGLDQPGIREAIVSLVARGLVRLHNGS